MSASATLPETASSTSASTATASVAPTSFLTTRTGAFPIGFRRGWSEWQKDLASLVKWGRENHLGVIDIGGDADTTAQIVVEAGLQVGSADLGGGGDWKTLISPDESTRKAAVEKISAYVAKASSFGVRNYFTVLLPENPALERKQNFSYAVESFNALESVLRENNARVVIEGWPGPGALSCTPEGYRAFFEACPSPVFGVNFDPSHLVRMGIDSVRFLAEFHSRVYHVHGKDTDIDLDALYNLGTEQPATFARSVGFGGPFWRYTIPGHGQVPWVRLFGKLKETGYAGAVSIELEDANYNGTTDGEKAGLLASAQYLATV